MPRARRSVGRALRILTREVVPAGILQIKWFNESGTPVGPWAAVAPR